MASRAHVIYDYSFDSNASRPRAMQYRERDPIVLPRSNIWSTGAGVIAVALAAAAIVGGGAYAAYHTEPATIAETPAVPLEREWQPEPTNVRAAITNLLSGPTQAAPSKALPTFESDAETPILSGNSDQGIIDESAPGAQPHFPQTTATPATAPDSPATAVPNPTTTPPDAIAPPQSSPETPTPLLGSENPY